MRNKRGRIENSYIEDLLEYDLEKKSNYFTRESFAGLAVRAEENRVIIGRNWSRHESHAAPLV
jgi:hypothetical protein